MNKPCRDCHDPIRLALDPTTSRWLALDATAVSEGAEFEIVASHAGDLAVPVKNAGRGYRRHECVGRRPWFGTRAPDGDAKRARAVLRRHGR
jgi:hypothetical protein